MAAKPRVAYREVTGWPPWVLLLVWVCFLGGGGSVLWQVLRVLTGSEVPDGGPRELATLVVTGVVILLIPVLFHVVIGALIVEVTDEAILLRLGRPGLIKKRIPFDDITSMEPVTYRPIREFGGWGVRFGGGGKSAWATRGNRALVIGLKDGKKVYVGSDKPEHLQSRISAVVGRRYEWA